MQQRSDHTHLFIVYLQPTHLAHVELRLDGIPAAGSKQRAMEQRLVERVGSLACREVLGLLVLAKGNLGSLFRSVNGANCGWRVECAGRAMTVRMQAAAWLSHK